MNVPAIFVTPSAFLPLIIAGLIILGLIIGLWTPKQQTWIDSKAEFSNKYQGLLSFVGLMITLFVAVFSLHFAYQANVVV